MTVGFPTPHKNPQRPFHHIPIEKLNQDVTAGSYLQNLLEIVLNRPRKTTGLSGGS
jgi:hypothetical protein